MPSTESEGLRPGAGQSEIELFTERRRDELDLIMQDLRRRLDVKTRSKLAYESFRRDYEKNPKLFQSTGIGIVAVAAVMVTIALVKRGRNG
jgi:hypothetical protein